MSVLEVTTDLESNPCCPHGPTVLFTSIKNGKSEKFYACSACRDQKECSFYIKYESVKKLNQDVWNKNIEDFKKGVKHKKQYRVLKKVKTMTENDRIYCNSCDVFVLSKQEHLEHDLIIGITDYQLGHPSSFLQSLQKSKKEAQYHFSANAVKTTIDILKEQNCRNIVCVGTPRIFEEILNNPNLKLNAILLDIDKRLHNFFGAQEFCWYNSMNNHFFLSGAKKVFETFLQSGNGESFALVTDPPFGIRVELLATTLQKVQTLYQNINNTEDVLKILWYFPYFNEPHILNHMPNFKMLDYKVEYENHTSFKNGPKGQKHGSPVRIFTNIDIKTITLPKEEGYKFCNLCQKWVYRENKHCKKCNNCTSKDGKTYVHCEKCTRCVKPTWTHCQKCNRCALPDHKCTKIDQKALQCFKCNKRGHKRSECKMEVPESVNKRRKITN